jgi:hypothetical protein
MNIKSNRKHFLNTSYKGWNNVFSYHTTMIFLQHVTLMKLSQDSILLWNFLKMSVYHNYQNVSVLGSKWNTAHCLLGQLSHSSFCSPVVCQASNSKLIIFQFKYPKEFWKMIIHLQSYHISQYSSFSFLLVCQRASTQKLSLPVHTFGKPQHSNFPFSLVMSEILFRQVYFSQLLCHESLNMDIFLSHLHVKGVIYNLNKN